MDGINFKNAPQFSSFHRDTLLKQTSYVPDIADRILHTRVQAVTFPTIKRIAQDMGTIKIDILHTDTEGFDGQVLDMMWQHKIEPTIVSFEWLHMTKIEMERQLTRLSTAGYRLSMGRSDIIAYRPPNEF
jgi:hypothetical protein